MWPVFFILPYIIIIPSPKHCLDNNAIRYFHDSLLLMPLLQCTEFPFIKNHIAAPSFPIHQHTYCHVVQSSITLMYNTWASVKCSWITTLGSIRSRFNGWRNGRSTNVNRRFIVITLITRPDSCLRNGLNRPQGGDESQIGINYYCNSCHHV